MSWQDELRRLDDELAAGRISADDYRSRRDQILSTAVSPGAAPPAAGESTAMLPPVTAQTPPPAQPAQPTPPAQGGGDADKTQIVSGQDVGDSDRTQSVGGWRAAPPEDPNRTQVVPGVPPQAHAGARPPRPAPPPPAHGSPPGGFPQPNQPPWQNEEELAPPWAGQDFPPLAAAGTPDWARQGPEVFETEKKGGAGKTLGIIGIIVLLLAIAAGAYFLFRPDDTQAGDNGGGGGSGGGGGASQTTDAPPSTPEEPEGPIVELPGETQNMKQVDTFEKVKAIDYLTPQEIALYEQGGATDSAVAISTDSGVRIIVLVVTTDGATSAAEARDALAALQLRFNLAEREAPESVQAAANEGASRGPLLRAHYSSGDQVVRVQAQGEDAEAANRLFGEVLDAQLERLPADG